MRMKPRRTMTKMILMRATMMGQTPVLMIITVSVIRFVVFKSLFISISILINLTKFNFRVIKHKLINSNEIVN